MTESAKGRLFLFLAFAVGLGVGAAGGGSLGFRRGMTGILDEAVYGDTQEVHILLAALKDLRAGKAPAAIESIEARLDDHLVMFDPVEPYPISSRTLDQVDATIRDAKAYRAAHPRKSKRTFVDTMVQNLFSRK